LAVITDAKATCRVYCCKLGMPAAQNTVAA
jgi:hypothetical protein